MMKWALIFSSLDFWRARRQTSTPRPARKDDLAIPCVDKE
jgi:hypothetical protein